jgi:hypothetical protein
MKKYFTIINLLTSIGDIAIRIEGNRSVTGGRDFFKEDKFASMVTNYSISHLPYQINQMYHLLRYQHDLICIRARARALARARGC